MLDAKAAARANARAVQRSGIGDLASISHASQGYLADFLEARLPSVNNLRVMLYVPIRHEIDPILTASWVLQRFGQVCVGRGVSPTTPLQVVALDPSCTAGGRWCIEHADTDCWGMTVPRERVPVPASSLHAVIVPGLAFDRAGHRLGRGKGVYDRFLATLPPTTLRIGLVPSALVVDRLPTEPHDVPMHAVVTELGVIEPGR